MRLDKDAMARLYFLGFGFSPVLCISLAGLDVIPLHRSGPFVMLPLCLAAVVIGLVRREVGATALQGLVSGIIAVTLYDALRLSFVFAGLWHDFIPGIGKLLLHNPRAHWIVGYAWRFILNGGGLGIPFVMLSWKGWKAGIGYGIFVCACLFATLAFSEHAQNILFKLTPLSVAMALAGHLVYGAALGLCVERFTPDPKTRYFRIIREARRRRREDSKVPVRVRIPEREKDAFRRK